MDTFEFTVAHNLSIRIILLQGAEQGDEGSTLGWCPGIVSSTFLIQPALITDADGVGIVMAGMHADLFLITGLIELAIALDVVVIAYALVVEPGVVAGPEHIHGEPLIAAGRTAVNDNKVNISHGFYGMKEFGNDGVRITEEHSFGRRWCRGQW